MAECVIREITKDIWTFSRPFSRMGLPVGGRATAIKLQNGDVWVCSPTPLDEPTKTKLDELGEVKYIVAPDLEHHLYLEEFKKAYPSAKVIGVEPLIEKKQGTLTFDGAYGADPSDTKYGYEPEITACYFSGFINKDVAFLHAPTRTLIQADLMFNLPATEQYSRSTASPKLPLFFRAFGPRSWTHQKFIWSASRDVKAMERDAKTVAGWDFDRIIPCHGDVIETGGKEAWKALYQRFLSPRA